MLVDTEYRSAQVLESHEQNPYNPGTSLQPQEVHDKTSRHSVVLRGRSNSHIQQYYPWVALSLPYVIQLYPTCSVLEDTEGIVYFLTAYITCFTCMPLLGSHISSPPLHIQAARRWLEQDTQSPEQQLVAEARDVWATVVCQGPPAYYLSLGIRVLAGRHHQLQQGQSAACAHCQVPPDHLDGTWEVEGNEGNEGDVKWEKLLSAVVSGLVVRCLLAPSESHKQQIMAIKSQHQKLREAGDHSSGSSSSVSSLSQATCARTEITPAYLASNSRPYPSASGFVSLSGEPMVIPPSAWESTTFHATSLFNSITSSSSSSTTPSISSCSCSAVPGTFPSFPSVSHKQAMDSSRLLANHSTSAQSAGCPWIAAGHAASHPASPAAVSGSSVRCPGICSSARGTAASPGEDETQDSSKAAAAAPGGAGAGGESEHVSGKSEALGSSSQGHLHRGLSKGRAEGQVWVPWLNLTPGELSGPIFGDGGLGLIKSTLELLVLMWPAYKRGAGPQVSPSTNLQVAIPFDTTGIFACQMCMLLASPDG